MARFFGTNGIRGVFPGGLSPRLVHDMALAAGTHLGGGQVLVGYDGRHSGPALCKAACAALNYGGIDCAVAGLVPTPCLEYAARDLGYSGGIMITASHNPPEYNGMKVAAADGVELSRDDELAVERIYLERGWQVTPGRWGATRREGRAVESYLEGVASHVRADLVRRKRLGVVLDVGNGAQAAAAPELAGRLGCGVTVINGGVDGGFPGRGAEPTPDSLQGLSRAVREAGADLGVAFDGDGDRSLFCDGDGRVLTGEQSALVLLRHVLARNPGMPVVTCLNTGSAADEAAGMGGSELIRTRVGSVEVSRRMVEAGAVAGFEENGGFMYGPHNQVRDGCMTMALMLELLAWSGDALADRVRALPRSFTGKARVPCPPGAVPGLLAALRREFPDADTTDGIKITENVITWVMIRPSGTEPVVRIYAEAHSPAALRERIAEYVEKTESLIRRA